MENMSLSPETKGERAVNCILGTAGYVFKNIVLPACVGGFAGAALASLAPLPENSIASHGSSTPGDSSSNTCSFVGDNNEAVTNNTAMTHQELTQKDNITGGGAFGAIVGAIVGTTRALYKKIVS